MTNRVDSFASSDILIDNDGYAGTSHGFVRAFDDGDVLGLGREVVIVAYKEGEQRSHG